MPTLTRNDKIRYNVDWRTEVIRRFSEAWISGRELLTVNMKSPMRLRKVSAIISHVMSLLFNSFPVGQERDVVH